MCLHECHQLQPSSSSFVGLPDAIATFNANICENLIKPDPDKWLCEMHLVFLCWRPGPIGRASFSSVPQDDQLTPKPLIVTMETCAPQDTPPLRANPVKDSRESVREKLNLLEDLQRQVKVLEAQYEQLLSTSRRMSKSSEADREKREALASILRRAHQQLAKMRDALSANYGGSHRSAKIQSVNGALSGATGGKIEQKQPGLKIYPILEHGPEMED